MLLPACPTCRESDVAVVKVETDQLLPAAPLGGQSGLRAGEWVVALGLPFMLKCSVSGLGLLFLLRSLVSSVGPALYAELLGEWPWACTLC